MAMETENGVDWLVDIGISECRRRLEMKGRITEGSGVLSWQSGQIAVHSDYGPSAQEKEMNQDCVVAWCPNSIADKNQLQWAVAVADGVTSSWRSELAAQLACWFGLEVLTRVEEPCSWQPGESGMRWAWGAIQRVGKDVMRRSSELMPDDEFAATWEYMLHSGLFLQTTLVLVWRAGRFVYFDSLGDAGSLVRLRGGNETGTRDAFLIKPCLSAPVIETLGPGLLELPERETGGVAGEILSLLTIYTDGLGHIAHMRATELLNLIESQGLLGTAGLNTAERTVQQVMEQYPDALNDNVTLVVVT